MLTATRVKPFIKWAGGKTQMLEQYKPLLPKGFFNYYEPFAGGGAMFFDLTSWWQGRTVLMDTNADLINTYRCVRDDLGNLINLLELHQANHSNDYYYEMRSRDRLQMGPIEGAARFIYLNKTCFNGLYRENSKGQFNTPVGSYKNPTICDRETLEAASRSLQLCQIEECSFEKVLLHADSVNDFVYFDPPYQPVKDTSFTSYTKNPFTEVEQTRLRDVFAALAHKGVKVMLSNSDCPFIRELYQDFTIHTVQSTRRVNSKASDRGFVSEIVVTSY